MPDIQVQEPVQTETPGSTTETAKPTTETKETPGTTQAAKTGQFSYAEDRSKWIPPHRLTEESTKRTELQRERDALRAEIEQERRRVAALAGVNPPDPQEQQISQAKEILQQMFPGLKYLGGITEEQAQKLLTAPDFIESQQSAQQQQWQAFSDRTKDSLSNVIAEGIGIEKLSDDQSDDMFEAFRTWVLRKYMSEMETAGQSQTQVRYERSDPTLLKEFSDRYLKNWAEPIRRKVTAQETARNRRVPQSTQRSTASTVQRPQTFKTLDERLDFAAKQARERGEITGD